MQCPHCGGEVYRKTRSVNNCGGIALALIVFAAGIVIFVVIPVIGWVIGPMICICALFMGGRREKFLQCEGCRAIIAKTT